MEQVSDKKDSNLAVQLESLTFITQGDCPQVVSDPHQVHLRNAPHTDQVL